LHRSPHSDCFSTAFRGHFKNGKQFFGKDSEAACFILVKKAAHR